MANAFGLGGMASMGVPGSNPMQGAGLLETLELVRKAWTSFALPPGMAPTLDPTEIERRVAELKSIEQWLAMNLTMLRGTIQAFEIQQSTLSTLRSIGESGAAAMNAAAAAAHSGFPAGPLDEAGVGDEMDKAPGERQSVRSKAPGEAARSGRGPAAADTTTDDRSAGDADRPADAGETGNSDAAALESGPFAAFATGMDPVAWWDVLQKQFGQVANTAMASIPMPGAFGGQPGATAQAPRDATTETPARASGNEPTGAKASGHSDASSGRADEKPAATVTAKSGSRTAVGKSGSGSKDSASASRNPGTTGARRRTTRSG